VQTVICMKWGTAYGADYANTLYSMVRRNTRRPLRFVCFTEEAAGLMPEIEVQPLPPIDLPESIRWTPWRKISLWQSHLAGLTGDILFFDLDVVVTGSIDAFFDFEPQASFCVVQNWTQRGRGIGNTSVFRMRVGAHPEVYHALVDDPAAVVPRYGNEQTLASRLVPDTTFWPDPWCLSFKHSLLPAWPLNFVRVPPLPADARVVCFTGHPKPDEAREGVWPTHGHRRLYKHVRPTPWVGEHWR
jgi:hypothetical protein